MTNYITLTEFVPGTKAKAQEVNANFSTLKDAINTKASLTGDASTNFDVANATSSQHAINKAQLDSAKAELQTTVNGLLNRFCIISANTTSGEADILSSSGTTLSFKIGSSYSVLKWISANGTQETVESLSNITGLSTNGTYTIIKELSATNAIATASSVSQGKTFPTTPADGDYFYLLAQDPKTFKRVSGAWVETQFIKLGTVKVASNTISSVTSQSFLQNGYNLNINSTIKTGTPFATASTNLVMPDYSSGVTKSFNTSYLADKDGFLFASTQYGLFFSYSFDGSNWTPVKIYDNSGNGFGCGGFIPIPKGIYYKAYGNAYGVGSATLTFYPTKGAI